MYLRNFGRHIPPAFLVNMLINLQIFNTNLEDENHPEGSAEGENCKEKMESKEESYPNRNCHEDRHRVSFVDQLDQNLGNHRSEENKFASLVD